MTPPAPRLPYPSSDGMMSFRTPPSFIGGIPCVPAHHERTVTSQDSQRGSLGLDIGKRTHLRTEDTVVPALDHCASADLVCDALRLRNGARSARRTTCGEAVNDLELQGAAPIIRTIELASV